MFTGIHSFLKHDSRLTGTTSILMFPIYGAAAFIKPVYRLMKNQNFIMRGIIYTICILCTEYITGRFLKNRNMCPWDYSRSKYNIDGVIRLDYAPLWFGTGLLFEKLIK
ncbi:MAG: putative ABC transporter permease [Lachnospiraceae bacterium]